MKHPRAAERAADTGRESMKKTALLAAALAIGSFAASAQTPDKLLWGDTHLHTNLSVDAYLLGNRSADADTAYRFAKGEPVIHPGHRARTQLRTPLDFLAVTDHAELMGVPYRLLTVGDERLTRTKLGQRIKQLVAEGRGEDAFGLFILAINAAGAENPQRTKFGLFDLLGWRFKALIGKVDAQQVATQWLNSDPRLLEDLDQEEITRVSWETNLAAAERHNEPGKFTSLVGWEYSPTPDGANLHRIVLSSIDGAKARAFIPFSANDDPSPEGLWKWLDQQTRATGAMFTAIPHNSNISKARMFAALNFDGSPLTAEFAQLRAAWETVAEVTQIKGTSETHPAISPNDEFAAFEFFNQLIEAREDAQHEPTTTRADYVRGALLTGLEQEQKLGVNPFKLGMIGSTDTHSGLSSAEETNFTGKFARDGTPESKSWGPSGRLNGWAMSASGVAAIWARDNTREEILSAIKRREVYGTTGPRIRLRFFGGYAFAAEDATASDVAAVGYGKGIPMGQTLTPAADAAAPSFLIQAVKDPVDANLDRVQVVKGSLGPDGQARERVFDVAWSGERTIGADGKLPAVGDTVDRVAAKYENSIGEAYLATVWRDPEFDPAAKAFYYVRVLQIPTPRNSLYDSVALQQPPPEGYPQVIQERAYSSPIWYAP
ncbi:MAG: DUF3604 domain-containing protein [Parvularculaceae bacterium]